MSSRRKSRTGHAYFLCFGERPNRAAAGDLGHSGGAWPPFDPQDDYANSGYAAGAAGAGAAAAGAGAGAGAAAASRNRRRRREQANATLPAEFANEEDPERYGYSGSAAAHNNGAYGNYDGYDAYNAYGNNTGYPEMQEHTGRGGAGALAAGAAAGGAGAYLYNNSSPSNNRRSSAGHQSYGNSHDGYNTADMSPHGTTTTETAPAPWTLPMMGWQDTHGPYSVAGVGGNLAGPAPQAQFMVSPSEANMAAARNAAPAQPRSPGPDYSHFDPPEVRDARAREAAAAALARGSFSTSHSHNNSIPTGPTSPRRQNRRLSSNHGSPINENIGLGGLAPPAYVDAQDALEEVDEPRRLHLTNAEPDVTDEDSSRAGSSRRPAHNHKDAPPAATYRRH